MTALTNWAGNQTFAPELYATPSSEDELAEIVASAAGRGLTVRAIGAGHSFPPVCASDGLIVSLERMRGITRVDPEARRVTALPGTPISDFGPALWEHGLCLANQGDIDAQHIAGAVATATHGSGKQLPCFSAAAKRIRAILPTGEALDAGEEDPALLAAAQVAVGMLGVISSLELEVADAFQLEASIRHWSLPELYERWDEAFEAHRHFSFFWMPAAESPGVFRMSGPKGFDMGDRAYVKIYDAVPVDGADRPASGDRVDRPYRIFPENGVPPFLELEHMVPFARGREAFAAVRDLMRTAYPHCVHPVEVRSIAGDGAYLSPGFERDTIAIAVHIGGVHDIPLLEAAGRLLRELDARPHWGKLQFMRPAELGAALPSYATFKEVRRRHDPGGVFLNHYLRDLFA